MRCSSRKEIRNAVKTVYQELWELLSLYEETECFNKLPKGEETTEDDAGEYMIKKICEIRNNTDALFLGEPEIAGKLHQIIGETEYFINQCEIPGVVTRWKQINPQLIYFDCAFDIMGESPELYKGMSRGLTDIHLSCYPDAELIAKRKAYFRKAKSRCKLKNIEYSEERIFQEELLYTLTLLFKDAFGEMF